MGYTHYFKQIKPVDIDTWQKIVADVRLLLDASPVTICNGSGDIGSPPTVNDDSIAFNGENNANDDSHESFMLPRQYAEFNFCKTAHKPYDLLVVASLCVADYHAPGAYDIGSDGDNDDWQEGLDFARQTLNNPKISLPSRLVEENA